MSSKFLVTGAAGATGAKTVKFLSEAGTQVKAVIVLYDLFPATITASRVLRVRFVSRDDYRLTCSSRTQHEEHSELEWSPAAGAPKLRRNQFTLRSEMEANPFFKIITDALATMLASPGPRFSTFSWRSPKEPYPLECA